MSSLFQKLTAIAVVISALFIASLACAAAVDAPTGQWSGNSQVDGDRSTSKTLLSLGAPDADDSTLRIVGGITTCTLKQGTYAADASGGWTLSFKEPSGGDVCTRLAKGTFVLRAGATAKQLEFDVKYPGADGGESKRHGALNRYP